MTISRVRPLVDYVAQGMAFEVAHIEAAVANSGGTHYWHFKSGDNSVVVFERKVTTNGDEFEYQVFKDPTLTDDGTPVGITGRNSGAGNSPVTTFFTDPAFSAEGAGIEPEYMPGASGQGQSTISQFSVDGAVRILEPNTSYLLKVTNNGAKNDATCQIYVLWGES